MSRAFLRQIAVLFALFDSACTFYTACPSGGATSSSNAGTNSGGAANGSGGASGTSGFIVPEAGAGPTGAWVNETFNLAGMQSQCGNLSYLSAKPDEDLLIATVAEAGLFSKANGDMQWQPMGQGKGSAVITNRTHRILYDPAHSDVFWESGTYNGGGTYQTSDDGNTFTDLGIMHNDFVTVDFTDPDRKMMLVSGHEQMHVLYESLDAGVTWNEIGDKIPDAAQTCPYPLILDPSNILLGCDSYGGGSPGIYRSTDGAVSWQLVSKNGGGSAPLVASDGTIYWSNENSNGIVRSMDQGMTWSDPIGAGDILSVDPIELPDGRIATAGKNQVLLSSDHGDHWQIASVNFPITPATLGYSAAGKAFYITYWTCGATEVPVPDDAIQAYDFDYTSQ